MGDAEKHLDDWTPSTEADRKIVYIQLDRMLESQLFRNSKRYPHFLRYLVEQALSGNEALLKERLLGVTVFHRQPDYDTNQDTVVRLTASEVRKRIAQYYHQPEHAGQLQIDLRPGSYVPIFRRPETQTTASPATADGADIEIGNILENPGEIGGMSEPEILENTSGRVAEGVAGFHGTASAGTRRMLRGLATVMALLITAAVILWWSLSARTAQAADRQLWAPILREPGQVQLVLADLSAALSQSQGLNNKQAGGPVEILRMGELVNYRDSLAQTAIVSFLSQHNKPYALELSTNATYPDLQRSASVLVGGLDNVWTMRVTESLRYHFVRRANNYVFAIEDRQHPELGGWNVDMAQPPDRVTEDFAIVARIFDQTTGRPVLVVAGLGANGTNAAAQFLLDPARTAELTAHAPSDWRRLNMEAVIRTQILDNHAGPPHLVTSCFW